MRFDRMSGSGASSLFEFVCELVDGVRVSHRGIASAAYGAEILYGVGPAFAFGNVMATCEVERVDLVSAPTDVARCRKHGAIVTQPDLLA